MLFSGITSAVTATWSSLSSLSDVIRQAYGIADARLTPLAGGYSNELWRVGALVVRVESGPPESVAWEHALVRFLDSTYRGNVLFGRGRLVGLVDWEESCLDLFAYELANAVWEFWKDKRCNDFDRELATSLAGLGG
jgi:phosphotransferase family enzyme